MSDLTKMVSETLDSIHFTKKILLAISKKTDHKVEDLWTMICDKSEKEVRKIFKTKKVRSTNSYAFFVKDEDTQKHVAEILESESDLTHKQKFSKKASLISKLWQEIEDKSKWQNLADKSKEDADLKNGCKKKAKSKTAYQMFGDSIRNDITNSNPNLDFGEITKKIAVEWHKVKQDENEINKWKTKSEEYNETEKEKHNALLVKQAIKTEEESHAKEDNTKSTEGKKMSSFNKFKKEERHNVMKQFPEIANQPNKITQKLNELWKSKSAEEKSKY
tara:strand:+ start:826 stop:1653 length:828 start_codon:yes stop_codon:yes gene_type:complete